MSAYIKSEVHNIGDVCIGVPALINRAGVYPVPIRIEPLEIRQFQDSVEKIRVLSKNVFDELQKEELGFPTDSGPDKL